jgi:uncharacterized protein (TIGR00251 family)
VSEIQAISLAVKVTPRASGDGVVGWCSEAHDELSVRVTAAPEGGKANAAVIKVLARSLGIPKSGIEVVRGHTSRHKLLAITLDGKAFRQWSEDQTTLRS